ncbi:DUF6884 domain-containing protein [Halorientalis brevis]|uniref:DUF6884 domain-containing protein n=1 Tax=Halorientalis brevis TaxID=1126241 RepID=A0ABD6CEN0_9EURY|nr:DUF6884 domain-containing protein [Halorientalis brevis]
MSSRQQPVTVERERFGETESHTVDSEDRPLYDLLADVLDDTSVPDLMPAHMATHCDNLADALDAMTEVYKGRCTRDGLGRYSLSYCRQAQRAIEDYRDAEPATLAAVGCSQSKDDADGLMPARERYSSGYWTVKDRYGKAVADEYCIISAKFGVLSPEEPVADYDRTVDDLRGVPVQSDVRLPNGDNVDTLLDLWALDVYEGLTAWIKQVAGGVDPQDVDLEILLGTTYRNPLETRGVFDRLPHTADLSVSFPFQEIEQARGGNGNQMDWMTDEIEAAQEVADS